MGVPAGWSPARPSPKVLREPGARAGRMPCVRLEPFSARWRRRMGSVGGWPLAIPITVATGGNRDGGPP